MASMNLGETSTSTAAFDMRGGNWVVHGGLSDPDTKLVHFGARDYDPETGRWMQRDPILFGGGQANLYAYVGNDPVNLTDPTGLLSTQEFLLCLANPAGCMASLNAGNTANRDLRRLYGVPDPKGAFGSDHSSGPPGVPDGGTANAILHCTWQCILASQTDAETARDFGDAHEAGRDDPNSCMDIENNRRGRDLAGTDPSKCVERCHANIWMLQQSP